MLMSLHSWELTWKPKRGRIKTTFPLKRGYMGFHVSLGECIYPKIFQYPYIFQYIYIYMSQYSQYVPICPYMSLNVPICPNIPIYPYVSLHVPICPHMPQYPNISLYIPICPYMSPYAPTYPNTSLHIPTYPYMSLYVPICPYISQYIPTYPYLSLFLPICPNISLDSPGLEVLQRGHPHLQGARRHGFALSWITARDLIKGNIGGYTSIGIL